MIGFFRSLFSPAQRELDALKMQIAQTHFSRFNEDKNCTDIREYEYKVFSQWGDDGIIQFLLSRIGVKHKLFVEFGVEDFLESNCRFLMTYRNWSGLILDSSEVSINRIKRRQEYWKFDLEAQCHFLTRENINGILKAGLHGREPDLISIDVDGNDYWFMQEITYSPAIYIVEYNAVFGADRSITVPYRDDFTRSRAHYSNLYFGASLSALTCLAGNKGYCLVGCNSAGNNAYFLRRDVMDSAGLEEKRVAEAYVASRFRESRDRKGRLSHIAGDDRLKKIRGLPVINVSSGELEEL